MFAGKNTNGEATVILNDQEAEQLKEMVRGANLPLRRVFHKLLTEI